MSRKSVRYMAFGLIGLLLAANNLTSTLAINTWELLGAIVLGVVCAELILVAIWTSLVASPTLPRVLWAFGWVLVWYHCYFAGTALADEWPVGDPEFLSVYVIGLLALPLVLVGTQVPLWGMRLLFRWRIETGDPRHVCPVSVWHLMMATVIVAIALACGRFAVSASAPANEMETRTAWIALTAYGGVFVYFGLVIAVPHCLAILKSHRPGVWFFVLIPYTMIAVGPVLVVLWIADGSLDEEVVVMFVTMAAGLSAITSGTLGAARRLGYRLVRNRWPELAEHSSATPAKIPLRRVAIALAVCTVALVVSYPFFMRLPIVRKIVQSVTVTSQPQWRVEFEGGMARTLEINHDDDVVDTAALARMVDLKSLLVDSARLRQIDALRGMRHLEELRLTATHVRDLSPLRSLSRLHTLMIADEPSLSDVSPLADIETLNYLSVSGEGITDLSSLSRHPTLGVLDVSGSKVTVLPRQVPLRELHLDDAPITDLSALAEIPSLSGLSMWNVAATDYGPIASLTSLKWLELTDSGITTLASLEPLTKLNSLDIDGTAVRDLTPLRNLNLQHFNAAYSQVEGLESLKGHSALRELILSQTGVSDLSAIRDSHRIQELMLDGTKVVDLTPLSGLNELIALDLSNTPVADLTPLSALEYLEHLTIRGTSVSDLAPLSGLHSLTILYMERTGITDLSPLNGLTGLRYLFVAESAVSNTELDRLQARLPECVIHRSIHRSNGMEYGGQ